MTDNSHADDPTFRGIFITDGTRMTISGISLTIGPDGVSAGDSRVTLSLDQYPFWLRIARRHVSDAERHHSEAATAWEEEPEGEQRGLAMEAEFYAAMQAITASGIAIDAFYASVKEYVTIPPELTARWRDKGTARYKQITEVLRRSFQLDARNTVRLRKGVQESMKYRDWAVHPPAGAREPVTYPEFRIGTEWRLVAFRAWNARILCGRSIGLIAQLLEIPRTGNSKLVAYAAEARERVRPLVEEWEAQYGPLYAGKK